jgi:putative ABC transport system substrate-binding protein
MRRRTFLAGIGAAVVSLRDVGAQQADRARKIGVLLNFRRDDPEGQLRLRGFTQALQKLGWTEGTNLHTEIRWPGDDASLYRQYAQELVAIEPDAILAAATPSVAALQRLTHSIPIVFANVIDPVGAGFVASMAHPGGNTTGFTAFEYSISGKWLDLLKEFVPALARVAVVRDPSIASGIGQFAAIQAFASSSGLELTAIDPHEENAIDPAFAALARQPNSGVIVTASSVVVTHRDLLITAPIRYRLPAVYPFPYYTPAGGLVSYGPDALDVHARAAAYIDRILRGERPANLPVQAPTKYQLSINLKTAKSLGIVVPQTLLARADEVIE